MELQTSWDDGQVLDLKLAELLRRYKLPATFYITIDFVGQNNYLNWDQVRELAKDFEIGSHTVSHPMDLKQLTYEEKHFEIQNSKDMLEAAIGKPVTSFCYPRGRFDDDCKLLVRGAGYLEARTTRVLANKYQDPLAKPTTIHWYQRHEYGKIDLCDYADRLFDRAYRDNSYFHLWGHSHEIDKYQLWPSLEKFLAKMGRTINATG